MPASPGDTVLDVGCGTGLCLSRLEDKVGGSGVIVGIDESREMLDLAGKRAAEQAPVDLVADAAIFSAVHDVMQSETALAHVFSWLRPGAPVAAIGGKYPAPWPWPLRVWVEDLHAPFIRDFTGFNRPWGLLADFAPDLSIQELAFGTGYLALGHAPPPPEQTC